MNCVLGIDTSCYTTSVALMNFEGNLLAEARKLLTVKHGKRGLAQSEMVFQHTRNLPGLLEEVFANLSDNVNIEAIGVSAYPRPLPDSYMPAFLVGSGFARALAAVNKIKIRQISHQEGHIFAGLWSAGGPKVDNFLSLHVSGGTTEIVKVNRCGQHVRIDLLGGTKDLSAGQMVDRVGVALGLPFPAGPHLEELARANRETPIFIPSSVKELNTSFSGPTTHVMRLIQKEVNPEALAEGVQLCIGESLAKIIKNAVKQTGLDQILVVGGVSSNQYIRKHINESIAGLGINLYFPLREYSADNAVGAAFMASIV